MHADTQKNSESPHLAAALSYVRRGWPVFPCHTVRNRLCSCGDRECEDQGKHPRTPHGLKDATTDETIHAWWQRWPQANIGIATGAGSGLVVIDIDKKPERGLDGEETLRALEARHGPLPETPEQITGGGGRQLFCQHPGGLVANSVGKLGPCVDVRADGGYVIAPPSRHLTGRTYEWDLAHHLDETPLADLPPPWLALLHAQGNDNGSRAHGDTDSEPIREGQRNDTLFRLACSMRAKGMSHEAIEAALRAENRTRCQPPLPEEEARRIAESAGSYEPGSNGEVQPEPEPLTREIPPGDPYPIEALGDVLTRAAQVLREVIQAPDAICAQSLLAGAALAVQGHADVTIDGRVSPLSEYFLSVAKTGERKTAADKAALAPHAKRQRDLQQHYTDQSADHEADLAAWRKARDEALSSKHNKTREEKKQALLKLGPEPQGPINAILTTEEPTYEGLVKAFVFGWPSTGLFSDEGGRFVGGHGMNPENQLKTIAGLSKLWEGSPITRTRGGDGNILLYGKRLSVHLMLQPLVSDVLFGNSLLTAQGILSRCLVAQPQSTIGYQPYKEADVYHHAAMKQYFARLLNILETSLPLAAGTRNELAPRQISLAPDAKRMWIQFHDHIQKIMRPEQPLDPIQGLAAKAAEHAARLAGILALVDDLQASEISKVNIESGIELVQFYLNEALRLFNSAAINPDLLLAEKLLVWARMRGTPLYLRAVYQYGPNAIRDKETARRLVSILEGHGWIRRMKDGAGIDGAHRREAWEVRP